MITLRNKETGQTIGQISEDDLQFLIDELEEETSEDQDYWLNRAALEMLAEKGAAPSLISLLESALGDGDDVEVVWERSGS